MAAIYDLVLLGGLGVDVCGGWQVGHGVWVVDVRHRHRQ